MKTRTDAFLICVAFVGCLAVSWAIHKPKLNPYPSNTYGFASAVTNYTPLQVRAYGTDALAFEVVSRVGGILFQGTAVQMYDDGFWAKIKRFFCSDSVVYDPALGDGERFTFHHACNRYSIPGTDQFIAPIVEFVASDYTAAVTLLGTENNPTAEEISRQEELDASFIVQFHPAFKDTLLGNLLVIADAAFVNSKALAATTLWKSELESMFPSSQGVRFDKFESLKNRVMEAGTKECPTFTSYIIIDVNTLYGWNIYQEHLRFTGVPYYSFWCEYPERGNAFHYFTLPVSDARDSAPYVYDAVISVGQLSAFFRWFRQRSLTPHGPQLFRWFWDTSGNWTKLLSTVNRLEIDGYATPGFWTPPQSSDEEVQRELRYLRSTLIRP